MREIYIDHGVNSAAIGRVGENGVSQLVMDAADWESEFPGGTLNLFMERADGARYVAAVERTEAGWAHTLTAADLAAPGRGRMQMQWMVGEQIARSRMVGTVILPSLDGLSDPPEEPEQGYLEQMAAIGAQVQLSLIHISGRDVHRHDSGETDRERQRVPTRRRGETKRGRRHL